VVVMIVDGIGRGGGDGSGDQLPIHFNLLVHEPSVEALWARHELIVCALIDDATMVNDGDHMRLANGGEAMRDDENGSIDDQLIDRCLNELLIRSIQSRSRFV